MSAEAYSGYEDEGDYGQDRLLEAGWVSADDAVSITDAARAWIRLRRGLEPSHNHVSTDRAAADLERVFIDLFGAEFMTRNPA